MKVDDRPADEGAVYLIEDRESTISPWGRGNNKLGPNVYTYSKLPGRIGGSCPGSTAECEMICYAKRVVSNRPVWELWRTNTERGAELPPLPADAIVVRIHVSGDFDSRAYIANWIRLVRQRPAVKFWGYTRSWQVPELLGRLERLRDEPNVQLFASVDKSMTELPEPGWRRAWIDGDERLLFSGENFRRISGQIGNPNERPYVCPEETGRKKDCVSCQYCISGRKGDVVFLEH